MIRKFNSVRPIYIITSYHVLISFFYRTWLIINAFISLCYQCTCTIIIVYY
nr:MAG TPA: hypothetical protein [Caudoviricetes sp.]